MKMFQQGKLLCKVLGAVAGLVFIVAGYQARYEPSKTLKISSHVVVEPLMQSTEFRKSGSTGYTAEFRLHAEDGQQFVTKHSFPREVLSEFKAVHPAEMAYCPTTPPTCYSKQAPS